MPGMRTRNSEASIQSSIHDVSGRKSILKRLSSRRGNNENGSDSTQEAKDDAKADPKLDSALLALKEQLPPSVAAGVAAMLKPGETIHFTVASDIDAQGQFRNSWLVTTNTRILVVHGVVQGSDPERDSETRLELVMEVPLSRVEEVHTQDFVGNGSLSVAMKPREGEDETPQVIEAIRFTRSLADKFAEVPDAIGELTRLADGTEITPEEDEARSNRKRKQRCEKCDRPFPHGNDFCPYCLNKKAIILRMFVYLRPYKWQAATALALTISVTLLQLLPPYLSKVLLDRVLAPSAALHLTIAYRGWILGLLCWAYAGRWIVGAAIGGFRMRMMVWLGQKIVYDLRTHVYRHLQELSVSYFDQRHVGSVMSRVMNDTGVINTFLVDGVQNFLTNSFTLVFIGIILFISDWKLAFLVLAPTPFMMYMTRWFTLRIRPVYRRYWRTVASMNAVLASAITGIRVVKSFAQEEREIGRFASRAEEFYNTNLASNRLKVIYSPTLTLLNGIGAVVIWAVGGWQVLHGSLTVGTIIMFTAYIWQFYGPIQTLCDLNDQVQNVATAAERVFQLLDTQSEIRDITDASTPTLAGRVEFEHVTFDYEENEGGAPVLQDIHFTAEPGQLIGLVGHSGSGKTTLVNLLLRFYDVDQGHIRIDGKDIRDLDSRTLREQIGIVLQEPFLFSGTVAENIAYGRPDATTDEIIAAAKAANAHKFVLNFTDAYDTEVGERGVKLSGGEKQRISIARAILNNPRILILDEATSAVDTETESLIQEAMERLMKGRTTFAIAHRLSTLRNADKLIVMDHGQIAEIGSHSELLDHEDGAYAKLVRIQSEMSKNHAI